MHATILSNQKQFLLKNYYATVGTRFSADGSAKCPTGNNCLNFRHVSDLVAE